MKKGIKAFVIYFMTIPMFCLILVLIISKKYRSMRLIVLRVIAYASGKIKKQERFISSTR